MIKDALGNYVLDPLKRKWPFREALRPWACSRRPLVIRIVSTAPTTI